MADERRSFERSQSLAEPLLENNQTNHFSEDT